MIVTANVSTINDLSDVAFGIAGSSSPVKQIRDPKVDALLAKTSSTFDQSDRLATMQELSKYIMTQYYYNPIRTSLYPVTYRSNLVPTPDYPSGGVGSYVWKIYSK